MKRTLSEGQSANTKKPRMGSNESKQSEKQSNDTKMTEEKMDVVATGEGKNRTTYERNNKALVRLLNPIYLCRPV